MNYPDEPPRCPCRRVLHTPDLLLTYYARKVFLINTPPEKARMALVIVVRSLLFFLKVGV